MNHIKTTYYNYRYIYKLKNGTFINNLFQGGCLSVRVLLHPQPSKLFMDYFLQMLILLIEYKSETDLDFRIFIYTLDKRPLIILVHDSWRTYIVLLLLYKYIRESKIS